MPNKKYVSNFDVLGEKVFVKDEEVEVLKAQIDILEKSVVLEPYPRTLGLRSVSMAGKNTRTTYYQGMCTAGDKIYLFTNDNKLTSFDMVGKTFETRAVNGFGHGNALAYDEKKKVILVATLESNLVEYNPATGTSQSFPVGGENVCCGVGYDKGLRAVMSCAPPSSGYIARLDSITCKLTDDTGKDVKSFRLEQPNDIIYALQGTCLYDNCLYVACSLDKGVNARQCVYTYDLNGTLLDTFYSPIHDVGEWLEIEDICFYRGTFYAGFNSYYVNMIWCSEQPIPHPYVTYDNEEFCFCLGTAEKPYKMRTIIGIESFTLARSRNSDQTCQIHNSNANITLTTPNSTVAVVKGNVVINGKQGSLRLMANDSNVNVSETTILSAVIDHSNVRYKLCTFDGNQTIRQGSFISWEGTYKSGVLDMYSQSYALAPAAIALHINKANSFVQTV